MTFARLALNSELQLVDGRAPEWVELIPAANAHGIVQGRDGRHWRWDPQAHADVLAEYRDRAIDLVVDWEHATQHRAPNGEEAPASAWVKELEIRDGALWGRVEWTPRARNQIEDKSYRFMSPVFDYATGTLRIARMVSVALTNTPNLHLQALNSEKDHTMKRSDALVLAITAALGLTADATDDAVAQAINTLKTDKDGALAQAANTEAPSLARYVPRADYDTLKARAENAEQQLVEQQQTALNAEADAAIADALKAGKITPATQEYHRAQCSDAAGLARFKEFVEKAPVIGDASGLDGKKPSGTDTALNAEQFADKARKYQAAQREAGIEISTAAAVRHVMQES